MKYTKIALGGIIVLGIVVAGFRIWVNGMQSEPTFPAMAKGNIVSQPTVVDEDGAYIYLAWEVRDDCRDNELQYASKDALSRKNADDEDWGGVVAECVYNGRTSDCRAELLKEYLDDARTYYIQAGNHDCTQSANGHASEVMKIE